MLRRTVAAVGCFVLAAGCALPARVVPQPERVPGAEVRVPSLAPAADLQRLIDPRPAAAGELAWLGADVASSVQVGENRWIWIFGDTLLGTVRDDCPGGVTYCDRDVDERPTHAMIANSVGVMTRHADGTPTALAKYWRTRDGAPAPILDAERPGEFLWPLALASVDDVLLIAASRHTRAAGLASLGSVLVRIENPSERPDRWEYTRFPLPHTVEVEDTGGEPLTWATALVVDGGFLHLFGRLGEGDEARVVVARFSANGVGDPAWVPELEYLSRAEVAAGTAMRSEGIARIAGARGARSGDTTQVAAGTAVWTRCFDACALDTVEGLPASSEASIAFDEALGWYTVQIAWLGRDVELYTALTLTGPWRYAGVVYRIPPPEGCSGLIGDDGAECAGAPYFAYAAKPHSGLARPDELVVSYNVNVLSADLDDALHATEHARAFYVPRIVAGTRAARLVSRDETPTDSSPSSESASFE